MHKVTLCLLLFFFSLADLAASSSCKDCVAKGCTYCKGSDGVASGCVCNEGEFVNCDEHSPGSVPLTSKLDCTFDDQDGESILLGLIVLIVIAMCVSCSCAGCCLWCRRRGGRDAPTSPSSSNLQPTSSSPIATTMEQPPTRSVAQSSLPNWYSEYTAYKRNHQATNVDQDFTPTAIAVRIDEPHAPVEEDFSFLASVPMAEATVLPDNGTAAPSAPPEEFDKL